MAVRGSPAKGVGWVNWREGSNPSFSAMESPEDIAFSGLFSIASLDMTTFLTTIRSF